jgi:hypothetical protein
LDRHVVLDIAHQRGDAAVIVRVELDGAIAS